jgi:hypothetical protein
VTQLNVSAPPDLQGEAALKRLIDARAVLANELG